MIERITREFQSEPILRVNVAQGEDLLDFRPLGEFSILDDRGQVVMDKISSKLKWRIKLESFEPAKFIYTLLIETKKKLQDGERLVRDLSEKGYEARIQTVGGAIILDGKVLTDNTQYRVFVGEFNSIEDAQSYGWRLLDKYDTEIFREKIRGPRGVFEVYDAEYGRAANIENCMILAPSNLETESILYGILSSRGISQTQRRYKGSLSFLVGDNGGILTICEIPLETYLRGVLPIEMGHNYPLEALKSQAVASRSWALANLGLIHPDTSYDFCSEIHCQIFGGVSNSHPLTDKAVEETRGEVLFYNKDLCITPYSALCGGHTDDRQDHWIKASSPYLKGIVDGPAGMKTIPSLKNEKHVARWVISQPKVYCNPNGKQQLDNLEHIKSAFRWEVTYSRTDLEEIIQQKTGEDIGILFDIIPLKRGCSGRLKEVEILGSRKNIRIKRELQIRQALSEKTLNSSCFIIESTMGDEGIPVSFSFIGAGSGHGVGMCQTGAMAMALEGKTYREILGHYYREIELMKIY